MKVYVLCYGEYDDYHVHAVFDCPAAADAYVRRHAEPNEHSEILEFETNTPALMGDVELYMAVFKADNPDEPYWPIRRVAPGDTPEESARWIFNGCVQVFTIMEAGAAADDDVLSRMKLQLAEFLSTRRKKRRKST